MMRVASCSDDISSEKKPTMPPLAASTAPSARVRALIALGDVEGDVGGERRLAHAGTAGEDDEIGRLQAAHIAVEIGQPGGDAAERAFALIGARGHVDGDLQGFGKALEAAVVTPGLGDLVEAPLRLLDLLARARIDRRVIGDVDDILADRNELAPHREVVDAAAIVVSVDDGRRFAGEAGEILRHRHAAEVMVAEERLERDRRRQLARPDQRSCDLEDAAMDLLDEMLAPEEVGDAVERVIVDEDRAEQRLLGLEVVRRRAIGALLRRVWRCANCSMVAMGVARLRPGLKGEANANDAIRRRAMIEISKPSARPSAFIIAALLAPIRRFANAPA